MEEWYDIPGASKYTFNRLTHKVVHKRKGTEVSGGASNDGYRLVCLIADTGRAKTFYIHRIVAELFVHKPKDASVVNHKDLDKTNNHESNLEWTTPIGNARHYRESRDDFELIKLKKKVNSLLRKTRRHIVRVRGLPLEKQEQIMREVLNHLQAA